MFETILFALCLVGFQTAVFILLGLFITSKWYLRKVRIAIIEMMDDALEYYDWFKRKES